MRTQIVLSVVLLALAPSVMPARAAEPATLTDATFDAIRAAILPSKDEERWREIPWRTSTWDAVVEAAATEKPVLLWAMNGHPLACT